MNYYNDNDAACAATLRELIEMKLLPQGEIDTRSIIDVKPNDLVGFRQLHFFCGVGGWPLALKLAGWPEDRECWTGSCPCFPTGTLIITDSGFKVIEDIKVGDMVLTHAGRFKPVLQVGSQLSECIVMKGQGHWGLICTPDHPFYIKRGDVFMWESANRMKGQRWANVTSIPFTKIPGIVSNKAGIFWDKSLKRYRAKGEIKGKGIHLGVYRTKEDAKKARKNAVMNGLINVRGADRIDIESIGFAKFLGYWLGDGWVSKNKIFLCGSKGDCDLLNEIFANALLPGKSYIERTSSRICCGSQALTRWLNENFGEKAFGKKIPLWLYSMPKEYRDAFLAGYLLSDGHATKQSKGNGKVKEFYTVSRALAVGMRILLNQNGFSASIISYKRNREAIIEGRKVNERQGYKIVAYETARSFQFEAGYGWGLVRSIKPAGTQRVYNIAVAEDESYTADGIVVHNCPPFSQAGKKKYCPSCESGNLIAHPFETGVFVCCTCEHEWFADGRHLWPEFYRLIRACRPSVCFGEQVSGPDGCSWLAGVRAGLEGIGYAVGCADLCAASAAQKTSDTGLRLRQVIAGELGKGEGDLFYEWWRASGYYALFDTSTGAPHIRQRLYWCAYALADNNGGQRENGKLQRSGEQRLISENGSLACALADDASERRNGRGDAAESHGRDEFEASGGLVFADSARSCAREQTGEAAGHGNPALAASDDGAEWLEHTTGAREYAAQQSRQRNGAFAASAWSNFEFVPCSDGSVRRIETGTFPLAPGSVDKKSTRCELARALRVLMPGRNIRERRYHARKLAEHIALAETRGVERAAQPVVDGVPVGVVSSDDSRISQEPSFEEVQATGEARQWRLREYGNAIVPQVAAKFILACEDAIVEFKNEDTKL